MSSSTRRSSLRYKFFDDPENAGQDAIFGHLDQDC